MSEEDRLLSDEIDENCNTYQLSELHEPRKRVSFRIKAFDSSYLEEVVARTKPKNWLDELLEPRDVPMDFPVESPSVGNPFMEPLHTMESSGVHPWARPFFSAAASLSRASSTPDLSPPHLTMERLEVDASAVVTSLEEESVVRVASRSLATSVSSTSSPASSASSTQSVAYCGIDVETVSDVSGIQSYAKSRMLPTIPSESEADVEPDDVPVGSTVICSGDVAIDTENLLCIVPQSQRETQEVGIQFNPEQKDISPREEGIHRQVWTGLTPRSYYCARSQFGTYG